MFRLLRKFFELFKSSKNSPLTRKMVLMRASKHKTNGLCNTIGRALLYYGIIAYSSDLSTYFPLFTRYNAAVFGASESNSYWWTVGDWSTGREDFLNWLIEQYKDDQTDLKTL